MSENLTNEQERAAKQFLSDPQQRPVLIVRIKTVYTVIPNDVLPFGAVRADSVDSVTRARSILNL